MVNASASEMIAVFLRHNTVPCWEMTSAQGQLLERLLPGVRVVLCATEQDFCRELTTASIAITWHCQQQWLEQASKLRILATPAAGKDYFTVTLPPEVTLLNGQFHGPLIAETAVGALLAMCRGILPAASRYASQPWPRHEISIRMQPLHGSLVGILGFGHIGQAIGAMLKPFGVRIAGCRRDIHAPCPAWFVPGQDKCFTVAELDAELPSLAHLILALPRSGETDNILDARRLALLPAGATVSNYGRGNAIVLPALLEALHSGHLAGAYLDVFPQEPLPADAEILACPNLWRLPHISTAAANYLDLFVHDFVRQYNIWRSQPAALRGPQTEV